MGKFEFDQASLFEEGPTTDALFGEGRVYRYLLERTYPEPDPAPAQGITVLWIMLNPSTADETNNDPTVTRVIDFSLRWGYSKILVCNLFAFRATDPRVMKAAADPVGPRNDELILGCAKEADLIVCAWGVHGDHAGREAAVVELLKRAGIPLKCLGKTKDGHPKHPLYLRKDTLLEDYP